MWNFIFQLDQIDAAIRSANEIGKESLSSLRDDIQQLINLTKENLSELQVSQNSSGVGLDPKAEDDPFAEEYALFKAELESAEEASSKRNENNCVPQSAAIPDIAVSVLLYIIMLSYIIFSC